MKKEELIHLINVNWFNNFDDIESILPSSVKCVATHLEVEEDQWESICVNVYACEDGYVGIRSRDNYFFSLYSTYRSKAFEYVFVKGNYIKVN